MAAGAIRIPLRDSGEVLTLPLSELPGHSGELVEVLRAELPPLSVWLDCARAYWARGSEEEGVNLLQEALKPDVVLAANAATYDQMQIMCALAGYAMAKGKEAQALRKAQLFEDASRWIDKARTIAADELLPRLARGMLHMARVRACLRPFRARPAFTGTDALPALAVRRAGGLDQGHRRV